MYECALTQGNSEPRTRRDKHGLEHCISPRSYIRVSMSSSQSSMRDTAVRSVCKYTVDPQSRPQWITAQAFGTGSTIGEEIPGQARATDDSSHGGSCAASFAEDEGSRVRDLHISTGYNIHTASYIKTVM